MISFQYFLQGLNIWYMIGKKIWENYNKNLTNLNNYGVLNDQIWTLFSKITILVIFCWIDIFSPLTYMLRNCLDG
jgi:hypothetical protein